ncbi:MAG TPA: chemotaxis protein CheA [Verrucomicrobiae bacterium]|nr:chemotaxis protein CheA [Verrucomicrobiae bacterium]
MSPDFSPELQRELLDDFFTECDEHLAHIREALVLLEPSIGKAQADGTVLEDLFRNFHSFKGISAIVGLRAAEELAHVTEDYLRELTRGSVTLSAHGVELLMQATQRLEQIAAAFRAERPLPSAETLQTLMSELLHASGRTKNQNDASAASAASTTSTASPAGPAIENAQARGLLLWKFTFVPSKPLDEKGVNINSVRARLSDKGEILQATPRVRGEGAVAFEFLVGMKETPADIAFWESDGITAELLEQRGPSALAAKELAPASKELPFPQEHNPFIAPSHVVRVDLPRLDELMRIVGEMVIKRSRFEEELSRISRKGETVDVGALREVNTGLNRSLRELREGIMRVRMVPVAEIFARMPFVVRDLARENHKKARLKMDGQQTEIDKYLIEQLKDPLLHLVRNSFSHGVETPEERRQAGKPEEAVISLSAATSGDSVIITVADDGRGINQAKVLTRAREVGLPIPEVLDKTDRASLLAILCAPGFSTRTDADLASGRGVGMAVVLNTVRALGGTLALETEEHKGSRFIIRVPLTMAIADTLIVSASDQTCAVPQTFVSEVMPVTEEEIRKVNGVEVIPYRDGVLPVIRLASFFRLAGKAQPRMCVLVLSSDRGSSGLVVDRIHGQREVVVRSIRDPLIQAPGVAGATELGDGRPVLILDGTAFTSGAVRPNTEGAEMSSLTRN